MRVSRQSLSMHGVFALLLATLFLGANHQQTFAQGNEASHIIGFPHNHATFIYVVGPGYTNGFSQ
jgi:hypothetical protein